MVTILAALAAGCSRVIVSDIHEPKLDLARKLGPVLPINVRSQKLQDVVKQETDGWGADVLFECSGYGPAMAEMFDLVCPGGKVALVGIPLEPFPYDVSKAQVKEVRVENVFRYAHVYPRAVAMIASGKIDVTPLITDRFAFEDSIAAFDFAKAMPPASVKVQIEMPS
jgi:D-xylulose reductase